MIESGTRYRYTITAEIILIRDKPLTDKTQDKIVHRLIRSVKKYGMKRMSIRTTEEVL